MEYKVYIGSSLKTGNAYNIGVYGYLITDDKNNILISKTFVDQGPEVWKNSLELKAILNAFKRVSHIASKTHHKNNLTSIRIITSSEYVAKGYNELFTFWKAKGFNGIKNAKLWNDIKEKENVFGYVDLRHYTESTRSKFHSKINDICLDRIMIGLKIKKPGR